MQQKMYQSNPFPCWASCQGTAKKQDLGGFEVPRPWKLRGLFCPWGPWIEISWLLLFGNPNNMELFNTDPNQIGMGDLVHLMLCLFCFQQKTVGWKFVSPRVSSFLDLWSLKRMDFSNGYVGLGRSRHRATPLQWWRGVWNVPRDFPAKTTVGESRA